MSDDTMGQSSSRHAYHRVEFLDGLRGLSILTVVVWHLYGPTYANFLPFGDRFSFIPIRLFWSGVELFFLISGFVILMTLERCGNLLEFVYRRWLRLFPAMIIASVAIFAYDVLIGVGPHTDRSLINLIPGLLFTSPSLIHAATGINILSMDTPFWSLYVEVSFYAVFGTAYFLMGSSRAIFFTFSLSLISYVLVRTAETGFGGKSIEKLASTSNWLGFGFFAWFASGALFFLYYQFREERSFILAVALGVIASLATQYPHLQTIDRITLVIIVALFASVLRYPLVRSAFSGRSLVFFGFVSYPLYLIHNNVGLGLTRSIAQRFPQCPDALLPLLPLISLIAIAWLIARYLEPALKTTLKYPIGPAVLHS